MFVSSYFPMISLSLFLLELALLGFIRYLMSGSHELSGHHEILEEMAGFIEELSFGHLVGYAIIYVLAFWIGHLIPFVLTVLLAFQLISVSTNVYLLSLIRRS